jgi:hypothetical protein
MIRIAICKFACTLLLGFCAVLVFATGQALAQTPTPTTPAPVVKPKTPPAKPAAPAKPVATARPVVAPVSPAPAAKAGLAPAAPAQPAAKQTPVSTAVTPNSTAKSATGVAPAPANSTTAAGGTPATAKPATATATGAAAAPPAPAILPNIPTIPGASSALPNSSATPAASGYSGVAPEGQRSAVLAPGLHDFHAYDYTLTAYGCFRNGTRLFCDFDASKLNATQVGSNIWGPITLVDDGGKITARHNAYFLFDDGTQAPTAYLSPKPIRFIIEYDDVNPRFNQVALVLGPDRALGIPVSNVDASQPGGAAIPGRGGAVQQAQSQQQAAAPGTPGTPATPGMPGATPASATDQVNQTINNVNDKKAKAQSLWQQLKTAAQKPAPTTPPPPKP